MSVRVSVFCVARERERESEREKRGHVSVSVSVLRCVVRVWRNRSSSSISQPQPQVKQSPSTQNQPSQNPQPRSHIPHPSLTTIKQQRSILQIRTRAPQLFPIHPRMSIRSSQHRRRNPSRVQRSRIRTRRKRLCGLTHR